MFRKTVILALAVLVSACTVREPDTAPVSRTYPDIHVSMPATKVTLGDESSGELPQLWQRGDRIALVEDKGLPTQKVSVYELRGRGGSAAGIFRYVSGNANVEGPLDVLYPVSAVETGGAVPSVQCYTQESYDPAAVVLSWHGNDGIPNQMITLSSETAVVCLRYTGTAGQAVSSVKLKIYSSDDTYREYRLLSCDGVPLSSKSAKFYVSIPEVAQSSRIDFQTVLTDLSVMSKTSTGKTFLAGNCYRFPPVPFTPDASPTVPYRETLRPHPRLFFSAGHEDKVRQLVARGGFLAKMYGIIEGRSNELLNESPFLKPELSNVNYPRETLGRVFYLAFMYRMTTNPVYAQRAEQELLAVAGHYAEWRPDHFLTTSEMTLAFAIGYDWLYDYLSDDSKSSLLNAMKSKGLDVSETSYGAGYKESVGNWNSVCCGCMAASALAIFETNPDHYEEYIANTIEQNIKAVNAYGPDGGYPEGYGYWHYGTAYQTILFEALRTALGYSGVIPGAASGFGKTGAIPSMLSTPTGVSYPYSDISFTDANVSSASFWLARQYNRPDWLYVDKKLILSDGLGQQDYLWRFNPLILLYAIGIDVDAITAPTQNTWCANCDQPIFVYRSGFDSSNDVYMAVKGGYPKGGHAHMDSGSFYYARDGVVWSDDLGADSYTLPNYWSNGQNGGRWNYFRLGASGHSTLQFDGENHIVTAKATITNYFENENRIGATVNLTSTFAGKVSAAARTVYLSGDELHIEDDIVPSTDTQVSWNLITRSSAVTSSDSSLTLSSEGKLMSLEVLSPSGVQLYILDAEGEGRATNPNHKRVGFTADLISGQTYKLHVKLTPLN